MVCPSELEQVALQPPSGSRDETPLAFHQRDVSSIARIKIIDLWIFHRIGIWTMVDMAAVRRRAALHTGKRRPHRGAVGRSVDANKRRLDVARANFDQLGLSATRFGDKSKEDHPSEGCRQAERSLHRITPIFITSVEQTP